MKQLVLMGEGEGDLNALPVLVKRLITAQKGWDALAYNERQQPFRIGQIGGLVKKSFEKWHRLVRAAVKRGAEAMLVVLDGDADSFPPGTRLRFCAAEAARALVKEAKSDGAGALFSLAVVFARREYESWLIAGVDSLAGSRLSDGRAGIRPGIIAPPDNLEEVPRDAKAWLNANMPGGYRAARDQAALTELVDFEQIRHRTDMRSFARLEHAIQELIQAGRSEQHIATPT